MTGSMKFSQMDVEHLRVANATLFEDVTNTKKERDVLADKLRERRDSLEAANKQLKATREELEQSAAKINNLQAELDTFKNERAMSAAPASLIDIAQQNGPSDAVAKLFIALRDVQRLMNYLDKGQENPCLDQIFVKVFEAEAWLRAYSEQG